MLTLSLAPSYRPFEESRASLACTEAVDNSTLLVKAAGWTGMFGQLRPNRLLWYLEPVGPAVNYGDKNMISRQLHLQLYATGRSMISKASWRGS